jgi:hypothetical protein
MREVPLFNLAGRFACITVLIRPKIVTGHKPGNRTRKMSANEPTQRLISHLRSLQTSYANTIRVQLRKGYSQDDLPHEYDGDHRRD